MTDRLTDLTDRTDRQTDRQNKTENDFIDPPAKEEIIKYCTENGISIDPERFYDYYTVNGWKAGNKPVRNWKALIRMWQRTERDKKPSCKTPRKDEPSYDFSEIELADISQYWD